MGRPRDLEDIVALESLTDTGAESKELPDGGDQQQARSSARSKDLDWDFKGHRRRQVRLDLGLSPSERLRWLEESMEEFKKLVGRARQGRPSTQVR